MIDYHIHIGQFNKIYYDAFEIFEVIEKLSPVTNINEVLYSSTSTCRDDVELSRIEEEISYAQSYNSANLKIFPYLWYIPKYVDQNITIESATKAFDYCGIKIHTVGQYWDESNTKHIKALHEMFQWADSNQKYLLIHCEQQVQALPTRFEHFFAEYTHAKIILAHSCPIYETMLMLNKYDNVYSDVACLEKSKLTELLNIVTNKSKILFGSDFPLTHFFSKNQKTLEDTYVENCENIKLLSTPKAPQETR